MRKLWLWCVLPWKQAQQRINLQILWPSIREQASSQPLARAAFRAHMENDPAYNYMTEQEKAEYVFNLPD